MNCPNCGYSNSDYGHRCIRCGTKISQNEKSDTEMGCISGNSNIHRNTEEVDNVSIEMQNIDYYEGTVINYGVEEERYGKLYKWFRALFVGIPYTTSKQKHHMQLMVDSYGNAPQCIDVLLWGQIKYGYIHNGNSLRVYGKQCRNGSVIAKRVINYTSSGESRNGTNVVMERGLSPIVTRVITGLLLFFIVTILSGLGDMGLSMSFGNIKNIIIILLLLYVGVIWVKRKIRRKFLGW